MLAWAGPPEQNEPETKGPLTITANNGVHYAMWQATARDLIDRDGGIVAGDVAGRTATTCYMRGLKERVEIATSSGVPWIWRRVCFTLKGEYFITLPEFSGVASKFFRSSNEAGYSRWIGAFNLGVPFQQAMLAKVLNLVFQGEFDVDWDQATAAKVSPQNVTVMYDKVRTIKSGNDTGTIRTYNLWHGMNKNLQYNDDELGGGMVTSHYAAGNRVGMGDYYVMDIFKPGTGGNENDALIFHPQATLYWHER